MSNKFLIQKKYPPEGINPSDEYPYVIQYINRVIKFNIDLSAIMLSCFRIAYHQVVDLKSYLQPYLSMS